MKKRAAKKVRTPREAVTFNQICEIPRDNMGTKDFWFMVDGGAVIIAKQTSGSDLEAKISIPRKDFNRFIDWYNTGTYKRTRK